jgi:hypothetical protein
VQIGGGRPDAVQRAGAIGKVLAILRLLRVILGFFAGYSDSFQSLGQFFRGPQSAF